MMAGAGGSGAEIVGIVRDEIDRYLITANHWGQRREDRTLESYQNHMSNAFGSIHQSRWRASPVRIMRLLSADMGLNFSGRPAQRLTLVEKTAFALQLGCGHCGEHATVAFRSLAAVHANGHAATIGDIVKTGNANIDHAFVVGGIRPTEIISTTISAANNSRDDVGTPIHLWNLRAALTAAGAGVDGYVCDPYLAPDVMSQTARGLLAQLNSSRRRGANKHTDFLSFSMVFPDSPAPPTRTVASVPRV